MIKLSDRLQKIADLINVGEKVADIGTDHGFLPIALWENGKSPYVILSDINAGPLEKAKDNINKYHPGEHFDIRLGSGLTTIRQEEVDVIVIAGMGGLLITEIIGDDLHKSKSFNKLILQPRNSKNKLREWLFKNGFRIVDEALVKEGKYFCEIIVAVSCCDCLALAADCIDLEISPILFHKKDALLVEFIENKITIEKRIFEAIKIGANGDKTELLNKSGDRIKLLQELRNRSVYYEYEDE